jgi:orotidine-5'-phosphate decarboxylase
MNRSQLAQQIRNKQNYLCVGLDTDITKIPRHLLETADPVFEFNKAIIDATKDFCVSYKINTAFYESQGMKGWESMEKTLYYIPDTHFKIADAKREIWRYISPICKNIFEVLPFDAVTIAPYMGEDSVRPFLEYEGKWSIVLGLTSNAGGNDFQQLYVQTHQKGNPEKRLYEKVLEKVASMGKFQ